MATHSSILAWRIPWTEEPGRLQSMRSQRVRHMTEQLALSLSRNKSFLHQIVMCNENWFYKTTVTTGDGQLSGWTEGEAPRLFPKPDLHQKIVMVTVWWSAASLIHCNFQNPGKTITPKKYAP